MHNNNTNFSCCCGKLDCPRLQEFNDSFKRVEYDAHLAAGIFFDPISLLYQGLLTTPIEVGQALLQEKDGDLVCSMFIFFNNKPVLIDFHYLAVRLV